MTHPTHDFLPGAWLCAACGERITSDLACLPCPMRTVLAPGHTDLMVSPEGLDEWLADNPPPDEPEPAGPGDMETD